MRSSLSGEKSASSSVLCSAFDRFGKKNKNKPKKGPTKNAPVKLNVDGLPDLKAILTEIDLRDYLQHFVKMGVTETRLLLRLSSMDFRIMSMEWEDHGFTDENLVAVKAAVKKYYEIAKEAGIESSETNVENKERKRLKYGRMYIPGAVQSFEWASASFAGPVPTQLLYLSVASWPFYG